MLSRRVVLGGTALCGATAFVAPVPAADFGSLVAQATASFQRADYLASERLWREATLATSAAAFAWANLAVVLVINASDEMTLGVKPEGQALRRLEEALVAADRSLSLDVETGQPADALVLNTKGNALGLLLRWDEARNAYQSSASAAARDFESIPRSNEALSLFELGQLSESESLARRIMRRDPKFVDATALLATLQYEQGDRQSAANTINALCSGAAGTQWCARYSTSDAVRGRWTPRAVDSYQRMIAEPSIRLEFRNGGALRPG